MSLPRRWHRLIERLARDYSESKERHLLRDCRGKRYEALVWQALYESGLDDIAGWA